MLVNLITTDVESEGKNRLQSIDIMVKPDEKAKEAKNDNDFEIEISEVKNDDHHFEIEADEVKEEENAGQAQDVSSKFQAFHFTNESSDKKRNLISPKKKKNQFVIQYDFLSLQQPSGVRKSGNKKSLAAGLSKAYSKCKVMHKLSLNIIGGNPIKEIESHKTNFYNFIKPL
jgi:hypothetical protein